MSGGGHAICSRRVMPNVQHEGTYSRLRFIAVWGRGRDRGISKLTSSELLKLLKGHAATG